MSSRPKLTSLDAFAKTVEDARIRTASGGIITLVCVLIVLLLIRNEYVDYTSVITRPELVVDRDINKRLDINLDISFPEIPCEILSLDLLDESGDVQLNILKSGFEKFRITKNPDGTPGQELPATDSIALNNDKSLSEMAKPVPGSDYCGSCYGALPQDNNENCCNDCETVKLAYAEKLWGFYDGSNIEQCEREGYVTRLNERIAANEGCRVRGSTQISRVSGTLDFAPGASFTLRGKHVHDLSLYDKFEDKFNFDHTINHLSFGNDPISRDLVQSTHPLDSYHVVDGLKQQVYDYYLKVVATRFEYLKGGQPLDTNQFSVITHDRPLMGGKDKDHEHTFHAQGGVPGVSFHFDISPLKIINREQYAKTWSGFVLGVISSIAGVLMVGTVLDRSVWAAEKALKGKKDL
ncbi:DUF1692-domain-containing protein [Suhomyces tanzawaensis NRRL Y-17324]|uniref:Endoplasmic reticulum-Golgi intermediate compartment protein n=1 Tax=Suhomyces tanzawaensis NRRL Y-17324 TaxID=984487 RepID=A0A1E4SQA4_9ASCO|nr:DUF1692-domain-containing protein [Suhomyces tanzawaensis NRRL Y-17324]ODV81617.1 DUF1692-domain-containing protein [Suhomyces tanzawaensis NRRL Y-17324]